MGCSGHEDEQSHHLNTSCVSLAPVCALQTGAFCILRNFFKEIFASVRRLKSVFNHVSEDSEFPPKSLLSYLKERKLIETRGRALTKNKRVNGVLTECVCLRLEGPAYDEDDDLPF